MHDIITHIRNWARRRKLRRADAARRMRGIRRMNPAYCAKWGL